jgi:ethanolamine utilization protein EutP (predicted NTPase)
MNELNEYQQRRLDLADMLRAVMHTARRYDDAEREREARQLLTRLAAGRFRLAVVGQFSRGKTTLMNALLGDAWLPMGALPMTSVITTVRYGSRSRALVRTRNAGFPVEVPVTEVARFVARHSAERAQLEVASVEVEIPAEFLRAGFEFVDTPGVGSANAASTAATLRFLPQADAVVFVTGFDSPLTQAEADFLTMAARHAGKLFLVMNKRDLVTERDAAEVTVFVQRWAREHVQLADPHLFALSALSALEAAVQADSRQRKASGIAPLEAALTQFLAAEQGRVMLRNVAAAAAGLVARQQRDLRIGQRDRSAEDAASVAAAFDARVSELLAAEREAADRIADRTAAALPGLLAGRAPAWQAELQELLASAAERELASQAPADVGGSLPQSSLDTLGRAGREITARWLQQRTAEIDELLVAAVAGEIGVLLSLARSPRAAGAAIAGLAGDDGPEGWSAEDIPALTVPVIDWALPKVRPGRESRRRRGTSSDGARAALAAALAASAADFAGRAGEAFTHAARLWAERLRGQAEGHTNQEADRVRYYLRTPSGDDDLAVLGELGVRLASYLQSLDKWAPGASAGPRPAAAASAGTSAWHSGQCVVCSRMETTLTEHLSRDQFLLATREHDQEQHARAGGFCPLHTWQYAHMASQLGIAAGYAKLAGAIGAALESIRQRSGTSQELARQVAGLVADSACPACEALAGCERHEVSRVAQAPPGASPGPLCLHHLALVLADGPPAKSGRALVSALAATLRRASGDMRAYALKREALQQGQVTEDEASAHADALRLLAGQPALVLPWGNAAQRYREWS